MEKKENVISDYIKKREMVFSDEKQKQLKADEQSRNNTRPNPKQEQFISNNNG